jgi:heme-degrading monooxygenase HmoA
MIYLLLKQPTKDINSWRESFDRFIEYRRIGGELSCKIYFPRRKKNELIVVSEWRNIDDVTEFMKSQSFEMIKDLEKNEPITIKVLNKQNIKEYLKTLN